MKESYFKKIFISIIVILVLLAIYICVFKGNIKTLEASKLKFNKKDIIISNDLRIGIIEFDTINPILSNNKNVQDISRLIFDPLFTLTKEYKLEGVLAKECSKIDDRTYIIKLNENINWHDGNKFDSLDVVFTIEMLKKLKENSIYYQNIKDISQVKAIDEDTLKIITSSDIPYFEYHLIFPIISSKYFNENNLKQESKNIKPVGTGMFYISDVNNDNVLLNKNTSNLRAKDLKIETIRLNLYDSLNKSIEAFKTEKIDIFTTANMNIEEYLKNIPYNLKEYINRNYCYISLNCNSKVLSNKEVRQAINYAINKEEVLKNVFKDKYRLSNFPLDFGSYVYDINNEIIDYDDNIGKNILIQNGWKYTNKKWIKNNNLKIELDMIVNKKDNNLVKVAEDIQEQLRKVGIIINVIQASEKEYNNYLKNKKYELIIVDSVYGYSPSLEKYFGENNLANYTNKEISALLKDAELSISDKESREEYSKITKIYNEEVPYISLYYNTNTMLYSSNLRGTISPNSYNLFYELETWYREYEK